jgi:hypothetical protein
MYVVPSQHLPQVLVMVGLLPLLLLLPHHYHAAASSVNPLLKLAPPTAPSKATKQGL